MSEPSTRQALAKVLWIPHALRTGGERGETRGQPTGDPTLVREFELYAPVVSASGTAIFLLGQFDAIADIVAPTSVVDVWTLAPGPLDRLMRPLRAHVAANVRPSAGIPAKQWRALGFERVASTGIQGIGSISWAVAERLCRRFDRPDLADRCRTAMLRTLTTARPMQLGAIRIDHYRRTERGR